MDDEKLFEMLDECVAFAKDRLETAHSLEPFAMYLDAAEQIQSLSGCEEDHAARYERLHEILQAKAKEDEIVAVALLARVTIPDNFNPSVSEGFRIHIEHRSGAEEKLSARFLYVPYQLYKRAEDDTDITVHLHDPIPVAFPPEIFTKES